MFIIKSEEISEKSLIIQTILKTSKESDLELDRILNVITHTSSATIPNMSLHNIKEPIENVAHFTYLGWINSDSNCIAGT